MIATFCFGNIFLSFKHSSSEHAISDAQFDKFDFSNTLISSYILKIYGSENYGLHDSFNPFRLDIFEYKPVRVKYHVDE